MNFKKKRIYTYFWFKNDKLTVCYFTNCQLVQPSISVRVSITVKASGSEIWLSPGLFLQLIINHPAFFFWHQEPRKSAEGLHARPLPLRLAAVPSCSAAEGPYTYSPFCSLCPTLPPHATPELLVNRFHPGTCRRLTQPATRHGTVPNANVPTQPQHNRASLPTPGTSAHLPQPQSNATAALAVGARKILLQEVDAPVFWFFLSFCTDLSSLMHLQQGDFKQQLIEVGQFHQQEMQSVQDKAYKTTGHLFLAHIKQASREWWHFCRPLLSWKKKTDNRRKDGKLGVKNFNGSTRLPQVPSGIESNFTCLTKTKCKLMFFGGISFFFKTNSHVVVVFKSLELKIDITVGSRCKSWQFRVLEPSHH